MEGTYLRGSEWRKWDLHVHTPFSIEQHFGGGDAWENYILDLEKLPEEVKVLGINDYLFIDGYERLLREKTENNRLRNIELLLPVVEFRIAKFSGVDFGSLKRINLHIIFSNELSPDVIRSQFLNAIQQDYKLESGANGASWSGVITKDSLESLGKSIKSSVPEDKLSKYGSDLVEGFRNINVDESQLFQKLESNSFLKGKYLIAVGKTEWDSLKWTDSSISTKKDIINKADIVFVASESTEKFNSAHAKLTEQAVNNLLLDCSDAHFLSDSTEKDRIGNCITWIKADPTFNGLKQILNEPSERVFVGDFPDSIKRVNNNKTKVIDSVEVYKNPDSQVKEKWFNFNIPLNCGLVAIIGNKGSGKSALADITGLLGNTKKFKSFSFLTPEKFCSTRGGKAQHFSGKLLWCDSNAREIQTLNATHNDQLKEKVKYIPQSYLEEICSEVGLDDQSPFYRELKEVIFSRIDEADKLGFDNLDSLLKHRDKEIENSIDQLVGELRALNREIIEIETKLSKEHKRELNASLTERKNELSAHESDEVKPKPVPIPEEDEETKSISKLNSLKIDELKSTLSSVNDKIKAETEKNIKLAKKESAAERILKQIDNMDRFIKSSIDEIKDELSLLDLNGDIISVEFKTDGVATKLSEIRSERLNISSMLSEQSEDGLNKQKTKLESQIEKLTTELSAPQKRYQQYLSIQSQWEEKQKAIIGSEDSAGSIKYLESQIHKNDTEYPRVRADLVKKRLRKSMEIYREKLRLREHYAKYYGSVQDYLDAHPLANVQNIRIKFDVAIEERDLSKKFLMHINHARSGNFYGADVGSERTDTLVNKTNFDCMLGVRRFLRDLMKELEVYNGEPHSIVDQLKKGSTKEDIFNTIFSLDYLNPIYNLKWDGKELEQLSPGERGNLLLIFYLILDQNDIPLIIDQPEENLDNQTVYKILVPCVKEAKKRRQIILVTHNPNLAVVCDAEQVIHAKMLKDEGNEVIYTSGSIENSDINVKIVDVLEGTRPAFDKRDAKYWPIKQ
jgi:ABC-type lipoprotein export system ATPase subunit